MKTAFIAYQQGRITRTEMYRYQELRDKLMGGHSFVIIEDTPEWDEFQMLTCKINS